MLKLALPSEPRLILQYLERRFPQRWRAGVSITVVREEATRLAEQLGMTEDETAEILREAQLILEENKEMV